MPYRCLPFLLTIILYQKIFKKASLNIKKFFVNCQKIRAGQIVLFMKAGCAKIFYEVIKSTREKQKKRNTRKLVCGLRCFLKFSEKCGGLSNEDLTGLILGYTGRRVFSFFS